MPESAARYAPQDEKWWMQTEQSASDERIKREKLIATHWNYYDGEHDPQLTRVPTQPNFNIVKNLTGSAVKQMRGFMGIPKMEVVGGTQREPNAAGVLEMVRSPEQVKLDEWVAAQDWWRLITDLLTAGSVEGHVFLKLLPAMNGDMPGFAILDAAQVTMFWDQGSRKPIWYRISWKVGDDMRLQDIVPVNIHEEGGASNPAATGWRIIEYVQQKGGKFVEVSRDEWAYDFAPIIQWQNQPHPRQAYGATDIEKALNDAVNIAGAMIRKILWFHAGPRTVATGTTSEEITATTGPDKMYTIPAPEAKVYNLEMSSDLTAAQEWETREREALFVQQRVVDLAGIKDRLGQLTNFGLRVLYTSMSTASEEKKELYGGGLATAIQRVLAMMGVTVGKIETRWADSLPVDRRELTAAVKDEASLGITSKQSLLETLGRDPAVEAEQQAEETGRAQDAFAEFASLMTQRA